jgi:hypothetical protein
VKYLFASKPRGAIAVYSFAAIFLSLGAMVLSRHSHQPAASNLIAAALMLIAPGAAVLQFGQQKPSRFAVRILGIAMFTVGFVCLVLWVLSLYR